MATAELLCSNGSYRDVTERSGFRTFVVLWFGQTVSGFGTALTAFAVGVWLFLETGSLAQLAIVQVAAVLPRSVFAPFAGVFVDRWNRRTALILSDAGSGVMTLAILGLFLTDRASVTTLTIVVAISSVFAAFQWPAYQAAVTVTVSRDQMSRAMGMIQLSDSFGNLFPPVIAGAVLAFSTIEVVIVIDVATFLIAVATLVAITIPRPPDSDLGRASRGQSVLAGAWFGFGYLGRRPEWLGLLALQFVLSAAFSMTMVLLIGYVLTVADEAVLGIVTSVVIGGSAAGAVVMTAWRGAQRHKIRLVASAVMCVGIAWVLFGVSGSLALGTAFLFLGGVAFAAEIATYRALWQAKVEPDLQGRVFAARAMIVLFAAPIGYAIAAPILEGVFRPVADGLGATMTSIFGIGLEAAYRMTFSAIGVSVVVLTLLAWFFRPLRDLETRIPDFEDR